MYGVFKGRDLDCFRKNRELWEQRGFVVFRMAGPVCSSCSRKYRVPWLPGYPYKTEKKERDYTPDRKGYSWILLCFFVKFVVVVNVVVG